MHCTALMCSTKITSVTHKSQKPSESCISQHWTGTCTVASCSYLLAPSWLSHSSPPSPLFIKCKRGEGERRAKLRGRGYVCYRSEERRLGRSCDPNHNADFLAYLSLCLYRNFWLYLTPRRGLFHKNVQVHIVEQSGERRKHGIHFERFYEGHLVGRSQ